eukprot:SAG11_NODE_1945_length_4019_cov_6.325510_3_plen_91_part_00
MSACSCVIGGCVRTSQWWSGHERFQFGVRGALVPAKAVLYHGAGSAIGKPAPSSMCGAFTAMYAKKGFRVWLREISFSQASVALPMTLVE